MYESLLVEGFYSVENDLAGGLHSFVDDVMQSKNRNYAPFLRLPTHSPSPIPAREEEEKGNGPPLFVTSY